jgi:glycosyltransferase involved in cell wall biosynthesis
MQYVAYQEPGHFTGTGRRDRYQWLKAWHADLSSPYDIFINFTHGMPPFCHAKFGVLVVLFPMFDPFNVWPWIDPSPGSSSTLRKCVREAYYEWEWRQRLYSYRARLAISEFTRKWTKDRWRIGCKILYPPVDTNFSSAEKANVILSVGRFAGSGVKKNQVEMATVFRRMVESGLRDWKFVGAGALTDSPVDIAYFSTVKSILPPKESELCINIDRSELRGLYERGQIFWHATGFDNDEQLTPELMEHFGIVTVEAMSAGCVPVVINRGGQAEIVEHGVSGFLWNTFDELASYTNRLIQDADLRARMSAAARLRSRNFDRSRFISCFQSLLKPALS